MCYMMPNDLSDKGHAVQSYYKDLAETKSHPLSRKRETELAVRIQEGDVPARNELVQANLRFVVNIARQYLNRGLPLSDLISAGNLGLLTAAERFDPTKGFKFISYAVWWIRQSIQKTLSEHTRLVRLPMNQIQLLGRISKVSEQLQQEKEGDPGAEEIAVALNLPVSEVMEILDHARAPYSLDETIDEDDKCSRLNIRPDQEQELPDAEAERASDKALLDEMLSHLNDREQYILRLYFGLGGTEGMTLEKIGQRMGVTRERVRQIKKQALEKLCRLSCQRALETLAEGGK